MLPEIGHLCLILAALWALTQAGVATVASVRPWALGRVWVERLVYLQASAVLIAFGILTYAFVALDFSVAYVAQNAHSLLPLVYRAGAMWGGHEGSLLLWIFMLSLWTFLLVCFGRNVPHALQLRVLAVMGALSFGFIAFTLLTSNPFARFLPVWPIEGQDLNPLLQDPAFLLHPPLLYMGYVGFSVAFAFAIAALWMGELNTQWARFTQIWARLAWVFLTAGIALGSFWAYYELGWGGWWFWDPVENASFMPWLLGTALLHSLKVTAKRDLFKSWTVLLAIAVFSLSLVGTFLVRSGILTSVHAFANDPERGFFILQLLVATIGASLILYGVRARRLVSTGHFSFLSREAFLLINNLLLVVAGLVVLLGTLYPLILEALGLGKISVGPPYFNALFVPLGLALALAMVFGQLLRWQETPKQFVFNKLWLPGAFSLSAAAALTVYFSQGLGFFLGIWFGVWIILSLVFQLKKNGMAFAHAGLALMILGVTVTSHLSTQKDVRLLVGSEMVVNNLTIHWDGIEQLKGENYGSDRATFSIYRDGKLLGKLHPEKRRYHARNQVMSEAGILVLPWQDVYVALGEAYRANEWSLRIYAKPGVRWIWYGALLMMLGGVVALIRGRS